MDFYELKTLKDAIGQLPEGHEDKKGWDLPATDRELQQWWITPTEADGTPTLASEQATYTTGIVHHSEDVNKDVSPDLLRKKLEILEYWDKKRKITVVARKKVIHTGENRFGMLPFFSANWWNRAKA